MGIYYNTNCIVKEAGKFQIKEKTDASFISLVLIDGSTFHSNIKERHRKYKCAFNNVDFYWGYNKKDIDSFIVSYNSIPIIEVLQPTIQVVFDYLNEYCTISIEEIEKIVSENLPKYKSELEIEIETLQKEKNKLESKISIYKKIEEKKEELKKLLLELKD